MARVPFARNNSGLTPGEFINTYPRRRLPSGKISDEIFLQAGLAVFAFRHRLKQKHHSAFQLPTHSKQLLFSKSKIKKPVIQTDFFILPPAGVELATFSLGRSRSIQLSYGGVKQLFSSLFDAFSGFFSLCRGICLAFRVGLFNGCFMCRFPRGLFFYNVFYRTFFSG